MSIKSQHSFRSSKFKSQNGSTKDISSFVSEQSFKSTRTISIRRKHLDNSFVIYSSDEIDPEIQNIADSCINDLSQIKLVCQKMKDSNIYFSFDTEIAQRIGINEDWDVSLCRMYVNRLSRSYITLLKTLVTSIKDCSSESTEFLSICQFLLPIELRYSSQLSISLLETLCHRFDDVFNNPQFDPIYQFDDINVRSTLFAASPRALITLLFFPQQPEPDFPNRLAIYLSIALEPNELCKKLRQVFDGEDLSKRNIQCIGALLKHLIRINPKLPLKENIGDIIEIPVIKSEVKVKRFYNKKSTGSSIVTNSSILKNKKKIGELTDVKSKILAEQLMVFDSLLLNDIETSECVQMKEKPTIDFYCEIIDNLGMWVSYSIKTDTNEINRMRYFIKVALEGLKHNSFNVSYALYTGISHFSLNNIFKKLPHKSIKQFEELQRVFDISKNYIIYRNTYSIAPTPKIPILPLWLGDIIHAHTAFSSNRSENGLFRMDALRTIANVLLLVNHSQRVGFFGEDLIIDEIFAKLSMKYQI
ncbi:RasGEF domain containing protein [Entamoeba histolytica HM-1:IMSS-B]|uniref:Ras-GEF domain-containing protein n=6 Tax=Entamoeba histolytica TaxID=5759 RepID=C4LU77_ENTH1|nr:hypothetical protein EHI_110240 [Entamoeba histolytica HM-1:IMSS]EMD46405.1 ras/gef domain containing protein [Entamoeba histolytica KU27]EMH75881.1 RasGEF domain containing protein [Entamoeba histolytica HM-1:IMSS-B]EMS16612.1 RasGEF domain containing protein [Entamoeba histolytica HM-3:IMSS]ENY62689.1 RasGEF domain containing protein [Entamoeba histolytica HM-1:IMSS-A]GAT92150.1 hypothetical protein CL6EHI_110240 [Entamoeba histolytica]|eukprot:XP_657033.1 hypothetical protein EHI_110240 [Entamoeba histolytica HM-1:IMSS]